MNDEYMKAVGSAIEGAAEELPENWLIRVSVERGAGWVQLFDPAGEEIDLELPDGGMPYEIAHAIDVAQHWSREYAKEDK